MPSVRYSFTGAITEPRQVLKGGYLTWHDLVSQKWWHRAWFNGAKAVDAEVPIPAIVKGNIRATIDRHLGPKRDKGKHRPNHHADRHYHEKPEQAHVQRASDIRKTLGLST
jgi:hypothetical protein